MVFCLYKFDYFFFRGGVGSSNLFVLPPRKIMLRPCFRHSRQYSMTARVVSRAQSAAGPSGPVRGKGDTGLSVPPRTPKAAQSLSELNWIPAHQSHDPQRHDGHLRSPNGLNLCWCLFLVLSSFIRSAFAVGSRGLYCTAKR